MKNHIRPMRRRKFLKTGLGMSWLAVFPLKKLFPLAVFYPSQRDKLDNYHSEQLQERTLEISLKYGGEFAGIKPERRRNDNGCV